MWSVWHLTSGSPCISYKLYFGCTFILPGTLALLLQALVVPHYSALLCHICTALQAPHTAYQHTNIGTLLLAHWLGFARLATVRICVILARIYDLPGNWQHPCLRMLPGREGSRLPVCRQSVCSACGVANFTSALHTLLWMSCLCVCSAVGCCADSHVRRKVGVIFSPL